MGETRSETHRVSVRLLRGLVASLATSTLFGGIGALVLIQVVPRVVEMSAGLSVGVWAPPGPFLAWANLWLWMAVGIAVIVLPADLVRAALRRYPSSRELRRRQRDVALARERPWALLAKATVGCAGYLLLYAGLVTSAVLAVLALRT